MVSATTPRTLYEKLFDDHVVAEKDDGTVLLYIDRHLIHEVTSPQAFAGLASRGVTVRRPELTLATSDHNVPTTLRTRPVKTAEFLKNPASRLQVQTLERNVRVHGIPYLGLNSTKQGIVHVIGPELGFTLPGNTIVCGDSHTSTHGAFGALAHGIGTSEVEHVLATQTIVTTRSRNMQIFVDGSLNEGVGSKDLMLFIIGKIGTAGGTGMVIEFAGPVIEGLSMESRMSLCNMTIEAGARAGLIAPDEKTINYIKGRPLAPSGSSSYWNSAQKYWRQLKSDPGAHFDKIVRINASEVAPTVTWGTSPEQVAPITGFVPYPEEFHDAVKRESCERALTYMGLEAGTRMIDIAVDKVFIGSCTNARIEDFRSAARILQGKRISSTLKLALAVPGSGAVKREAEAEGLDVIFKRAGFEWRDAGCSLCVGLNDDALQPFERCASTSNRNFESRQGTAGRTHLVSPATAAATAISGKLADVRLEKISAIGEKTKLSYSYTSEDDTDNSNDSDTDVNVDERLPTKSLDGPSPKKRFVPKKALKGVESVKGRAVVMNRSNIDTDAIFPKQFCTTIERRGLGDALFYNLRYDEKGTPKPSFVLNQPESRGVPILLVSGPNFGCGSSREHAVWALQDFGFRCVLAPSFADIFYNNSFKNGLFLAKLEDKTMERALEEAQAGREIQVDLVTRTVRDRAGIEIGTFKIEDHRRQELLQGIDEIDTTLTLQNNITAFEDKRRMTHPWLDGCVREGWTAVIGRKTSGRKMIQISQQDPNLLKW